MDSLCFFAGAWLALYGTVTATNDTESGVGGLALGVNMIWFWVSIFI